MLQGALGLSSSLLTSQAGGSQAGCPGDTAGLGWVLGVGDTPKGVLRGYMVAPATKNAEDIPKVGTTRDFAHAHGGAVPSVVTSEQETPGCPG